MNIVEDCAGWDQVSARRIANCFWHNVGCFVLDCGSIRREKRNSTKLGVITGASSLGAAQDCCL